MADIVSAAKRSEMMAGIRGKDTRPEMVIRRGLHALGYRYRLHVKRLPGKPDLVFGPRRAAIFVHGCFWHRHDCHMFKWPKTRRAFWRKKFEANCRNDGASIEALRKQGWRVLVVWECAIKGKRRLSTGRPVVQAARWLESRSRFREIRGRG